jgi:hypothetical protein
MEIQPLNLRQFEPNKFFWLTAHEAILNNIYREKLQILYNRAHYSQELLHIIKNGEQCGKSMVPRNSFTTHVIYHILNLEC